MEKKTSFGAVPREASRAGSQLTNLQKAELIRGVDVFSCATVEELFRLASIVREVQFAAGEIVVRENDIANALYLIVQGNVELTSRNETWREVVESRQAFGLHSILTREPLTYSAQALEDTLALAMGGEDFYSLLASDPEIITSLFKHFVKKGGVAR